jgi:hypothetical protein
MSLLDRMPRNPQNVHFGQLDDHQRQHATLADLLTIHFQRKRFLGDPFISDLWIANVPTDAAASRDYFELQVIKL